MSSFSFMFRSSDPSRLQSWSIYTPVPPCAFGVAAKGLRVANKPSEVVSAMPFVGGIMQGAARIKGQRSCCGCYDHSCCCPECQATNICSVCWRNSMPLQLPGKVNKESLAYYGSLSPLS